MDEHPVKKKSNISHRFLDEAGDTTFFADNKVIIGNCGVSLSFAIGMVKINAGRDREVRLVRADARGAAREEYP